MITSRSLRSPGFTLVEMMVSLALLISITLVMLSITNNTTRIWQYTSSRSEQFNNASLAFQAITQRLSQATLNTYWDYDSATQPKTYQRQSQLRFLVDQASAVVQSTSTSSANPPGQAVFFQAPLGFSESKEFAGLPNLLNTWGYFLQFGEEDRPQLIKSMNALAPPVRYRYRLMELMDPSGRLGVYNLTPADPKKWFTDPLLRQDDDKAQTKRATHLLAENVVALVVLPQIGKADALKYEKDNTGKSSTLSPDYKYDSTTKGTGIYSWLNQLPPVVQVTLVAIDEASAKRAASSSTPPTKLNALLTSRFTKAADYDKDLESLTKALADPAQAGQVYNYRVFTSNVSLRGARWSPN